MKNRFKELNQRQKDVINKLILLKPMLQEINTELSDLYEIVRFQETGTTEEEYDKLFNGIILPSENGMLECLDDLIENIQKNLSE